MLNSIINFFRLINEAKALGLIGDAEIMSYFQAEYKQQAMEVYTQMLAVSGQND